MMWGKHRLLKRTRLGRARSIPTTFKRAARSSRALAENACACSHLFEGDVVENK
jgi:hypothetical protein